mmetsp:Transcript_111194/g.310656  ORF Transcript_111194/g.310656 Transcript_111194/m.310656 type:complete len:200 (-) Transcript_111194:445-1044(-)
MAPMRGTRSPLGRAGHRCICACAWLCVCNWRCKWWHSQSSPVIPKSSHVSHPSGSPLKLWKRRRASPARQYRMPETTTETKSTIDKAPRSCTSMAAKAPAKVRNLRIRKSLKSCCMSLTSRITEPEKSQKPPPEARAPGGPCKVGSLLTHVDGMRFRYACASFVFCQPCRKATSSKERNTVPSRTSSKWKSSSISSVQS